MDSMYAPSGAAAYMPTQIFTSDSTQAVVNGLGWDGAHFYVGRQDSPQELFKLNTTFGYLETIALSNLNTAAVNDLTFMNGHAYVADTGGYVHDYLVADWSWQSSVTADVKGITTDGTSLWTVGGGSTVKKMTTSLVNDGIFYTGRTRMDGIAYDGMNFFVYDYAGSPANQIVKYGISNWDGSLFPTNPMTGSPNQLGAFQAFAGGDGRGMTFTWEDRTTPTLWLNARAYGIWKFQ